MSLRGRGALRAVLLQRGASAHRTVVNNFIDDMHRPALPYKFKFKVSGCPNDCMNSIQRADMAVIGTWRDDMRVDQKRSARPSSRARHATTSSTTSSAAARPRRSRWSLSDKVKADRAHLGRQLSDGNALGIDNRNCVRCMHCINVMTKALEPGDDKGVTILIGGKRTLKIGDTMGTVVVPFMKLETDEDFEKLNELARNIIDFFAENALEHERTGEMIERIGLANFLEGMDIPVDPNMISAAAFQPLLPLRRLGRASREVDRAQAAGGLNPAANMQARGGTPGD